MTTTACEGCRERDARIAELEARVAERDRVQSEESRIERDLRLLTGDSDAMKAFVRRFIKFPERIAPC
jgi:hypothetical protein